MNISKLYLKKLDLKITNRVKYITNAAVLATTKEPEIIVQFIGQAKST